MIEPGKIPQFSGNLEAVETAASKLKSAGPKITGTGASVHSTFQGLAAHYHAPEAGELFASTGPVKSKASTVGGDITSVAAALSTYVSEMRPIANRLKALQADARDFVDGVDGDDDWRKDGDKVNAHNDLLTGVNAKVVEMMATERECANTIERLVGGKTWHAGSDPDDPRAYGPESIPDDAETPWGKPEEKDEPWWKDTLNAIGSYYKGVFVDGLWGLVQGVGTLVPVMPLLGSLGVPGMPSWSDAGMAWKNLGMAGVGFSALATVGPAVGYRPRWLRDCQNAALGMVKGIVAYDMWGKDPARAAGATVFNAATFFIPGPKGLGALTKGGRAGKAATAAEDGARFADDATSPGGMVDDLARSGSVGDDLGRAGGLPKSGNVAADITKTLDDVKFNGLDDLGKNLDDLTPAKVADDGVPHTNPAHDTPPGHAPAGEAPHGHLPDDAARPGPRGEVPEDAKVPAGVGAGHDAAQAGEHARQLPDDVGRAGDDAGRVGHEPPSDHGAPQDGHGGSHGADGGDGGHGFPDGAADGGGNPHGGVVESGWDGPLGAQPDGSWVGTEHGTAFRLSSDANAAVDRFMHDAADAEPRITDQVTSVIDDSGHSHPVGLDKALKGEESLKPKIAKELQANPDATPGDVLDHFNDSVRYTMETPPGHYADSVQQAVGDLRARGFESVKLPDPARAWGNPAGYKGLNTTWLDPRTGQLFELQFHTPESFAAKEATHPLYEAQRVASDPAEVARLEAEQAKTFRQVPVPLGLDAIRLH